MHPRSLKFSAPYGQENQNLLQFRPSDRYQRSLYDIDINPSTKASNKINRVLVVDSADRNHTKYPNPNNYSLKFKKVYKDVVTIELKSADIPNSGYIITSFNNKFYWQDQSDQISAALCHVVQIPVGNYTIAEIVANLQEEINDFNTGSTYTVAVDTHNNKVTITQSSGSGLFNILAAGDPEVYGSAQGTIIDPLGVAHTVPKETRPTYREDALAPVLGFSRKDLTGDTEYTSQNTYNLKTDKYIVLKIRNLERVDSVNSYADGCFCVIQLDSSVNNFQFAKNFDQIDNDVYEMRFSQPIPEINEMDIEFVNSGGRPYEFNGHDHLLTFQITSLSQNDMFTGQN